MSVERNESLDLELLLEHSVLVRLLVEVPGDELDDDLKGEKRETRSVNVRSARFPLS